jgi:hypothetical protein
MFAAFTVGTLRDGGDSEVTTIWQLCTGVASDGSFIGWKGRLPGFQWFGSGVYLADGKGSQSWNPEQGLP